MRMIAFQPDMIGEFTVVNSINDTDRHQLSLDLARALKAAVSATKVMESKCVKVLLEVEKVYTSGFLVDVQSVMKKTDWEQVEEDFLKYIGRSKEYITSNYKDDAAAYMRLIRQSLKVYSLFHKAKAFRSPDSDALTQTLFTNEVTEKKMIKVWASKKILPKDKQSEAGLTGLHSFKALVGYAELYFRDDDDDRKSKAKIALENAYAVLDECAASDEITHDARDTFKKLANKCLEITNADKMLAEEAEKEKLDKEKKAEDKKKRKDALELPPLNVAAVA